MANIKFDPIRVNFSTNKNKFDYPDFLEIVTKERMIELFSSVFHNPTTDLKLKDSKILSISEIEEIDGKFYSKIQFSRTIVVKESSRDDEDHEVTLAKYAEVFGKEDVSYDEEIDRFLILSEVNAVAISNDGTTLWSFISISKSQRDFLKGFLPKEILDNI